jgi:hypothetical protein
MSRGEWRYRLRQSVDRILLYWQWRLGRGLCRPERYARDVFAFCRAKAALLDVPFRFEPGAAEIDELLAGAAPALGFAWRWHNDPGVWHGAPDSRRVWPRAFFGRISYRPGNHHGDARVIWEPSRLQHLVSLALIARGGEEPRSSFAAGCIEAQLLSWLEANPPLTGVHYVSAMECALRLVAVCHALDLARGRISAASAVWRLLPGFVRTHAGLVARRLSLFSSLGNHTIAECTGLIYAGYLFAEFPEARRWRETGVALLATAAGGQILDDGGGAEQAFWYHAFVVDLCGLAERLIRAHGDLPPAALTAAVVRGREFLAAFADAPARLPDIGDRDDGYALSPHLRLSWPDRAAERRLRVFRTSGYTQVPLGADAALLFDHGPLGMAPAHGHGHADALAVLLSVQGRAVLADAGTYGYGVDPVWRRYFRGTPAHNTVTVDDSDQAVQETPFQWRAPYRARLVHLEERSGGRVMALACHDGYAHDGVVHWRALVADPGIGVAVIDCLAGAGQHAFCANWHCATGVQQAGAENRFLLTGAKALSLEVEGGAVSLRAGALAPLAGWIAPIYGVKAPIATVAVAGSGVLPRWLGARLRLDGAFAPLAGEQEALDTVKRWIADG